MKVFTVIFIAVLVFLSFGLAAEEKKLPEVGSIYLIDRAEFYVRGVGDKPFEYKATGESLAIVILKIPGTMVFIPKKGALVKVDPRIPMVWIDGKAKNEFKTNSYLKKHGKNKVFLLLEYKR